MSIAVSAVIPTIGRPSLARAVQSVLDQTRPVAEVIVVVDDDDDVALPADDRITVLGSAFAGSGPARCRQQGIDEASGSVIALLDDDDEWHPTKLAKQLDEIRMVGSPHWIASSRISAAGGGKRPQTWPRRLIQPGESVAEYLFRMRDFTLGGAVLQTSTLCFPTELARRVRWDGHADSAHDELSWLIKVQRAVPDVRVVQLPEVLSTYDVSGQSVSRDTDDRVDDYIEWGLRYLAGESPRILGDYLCTSPVSAAVSAGSLSGLHRGLRAGVRYGRPSPCALTYAVLNAVRIVGGRAWLHRRP